MSWQAVNAVMDASATKGSELLMMYVLANYADEKNECFPSFRTLAKNTRMSERHTIRIVSRLIEKREIERVTSGGGRASNRYRILLLKPPDDMSSPVIEVSSDKLSSPLKGTPALSEARQTNRAPVLTHESSSNGNRNEINNLLSVVSPYFPKEWMDDPLFAEAWNAFMEVRRRKKAVNSEFALKQIGNTLTSLGKPKAISALTKSAVSGWTDVYEPKNFSSREEKVKRPPRIYTPEEVEQHIRGLNSKGRAWWLKRYKACIPESWTKNETIPPR